MVTSTPITIIIIIIIVTTSTCNNNNYVAKLTTVKDINASINKHAKHYIN